MVKPRALITGATGFIGRQLAARLETDSWRVVRAVRSGPEGLPSGYLGLGPSPWDAGTFAAAIAVVRPDVIFHFAGVTRSNTAAAFYATNVTMCAHLLDAVAASNIHPRVVLAGSAAEYGFVPEEELPVREDMICSPITHNGISKYAQTQLGLAFNRGGERVLVTRIFNPIGTGMPEHLALGSFAAQIRSAKPILSVGNLSVERDFIDVAEAARLISALASTPANFGRIFNICSGVGYSLHDLVDKMVYLSGHPIRLQVSTERLRAGEMRCFRGSTANLEAAGLTITPSDLSLTLSRLITG